MSEQARCITCGAMVEIVSSDEGTSHYEPTAERALAEALAREAIKDSVLSMIASEDIVITSHVLPGNQTLGISFIARKALSSSPTAALLLAVARAAVNAVETWKYEGSTRTESSAVSESDVIAAVDALRADPGWPAIQAPESPACA